MLWMLQVSERRYRAVQEVLDGASVTAAARPGAANGACLVEPVCRRRRSGGFG
jgi:hypothetical protein